MGLKVGKGERGEESLDAFGEGFMKERVRCISTAVLIPMHFTGYK